MAADVRVVEVTGTGPDFDALVAVWQASERLVNPGDPPPLAADLEAQLFASPPEFRYRAWLATRAGEAAGGALYEQEIDGANDGEVELYAMTLPAHRRTGVAWALAGPGLDALAEAGARSVLGWTHDETGAAFCRALGMTHRQDERCSRLLVADVDEAQQRAWIDDAPARAAGYRLVGWSGVTPDEWAAPVATALDSMVDAPLDDLDWDPQPVSGAQQQRREAWWLRRGYEAVTTLALAPDGSPAGISQLLVSPDRPEIGAQSDTGVLAAHRGHALGRWLKAENLRRAREREPRLAVVETYNAESNPHMLAINVAMGFRPHIVHGTYQGALGSARAALEARMAPTSTPTARGVTSTRMTTTQGHLASGPAPGRS